MLEKFIIHLKNIIFFKLVIYCLFISVLIWLIQDFKNKYLESAIANENAQMSLAEESLKLFSIINSKSKILETYKNYTELLNISNSQRCFEKINIMKNVENLSSKYHLQQAVTAKMTQVFPRNANQQERYFEDKIKIKNYDIKLKFSTTDFLTALAITKEALSYMPDKSIVTSAKIKKQSVLESKLIYKLSDKKFPELVFTKLNMRIREIIVQK